jgi:hypothetical protein
MSDQTKLRETKWCKKLNDDYRPLVDAVRNLEDRIVCREQTRMSEEPTMTFKEADKDVEKARGKLFVVLYTALTGEQISR